MPTVAEVFFVFPLMKLDKTLLKKYFEEHHHENLPDFSDKVCLESSVEGPYLSSIYWFLDDHYPRVAI